MLSDSLTVRATIDYYQVELLDALLTFSISIHFLDILLEYF